MVRAVRILAGFAAARRAGLWETATASLFIAAAFLAFGLVAALAVGGVVSALKTLEADR